MNDTRNNTWAIGIIAVLIAGLVAMCACMFGLAVGVGIGQARARAQIDNVREFMPEQIMPVLPEMPVFPEDPQNPGMPELPELDQMMEMMNGAMVGEVVAGGPAEQAGIEPGDLIIAVDGDEITPDTTLPDMIRAYAPGDEVTLTVVSLSQGNMSEEDVVIVLGANPDDESIGFLGVRVVPFLSGEEPGNP